MFFIGKLIELINGFFEKNQLLIWTFVYIGYFIMKIKEHIILILTIFIVIFIVLTNPFNLFVILKNLFMNLFVFILQLFNEVYIVFKNHILLISIVIAIITVSVSIFIVLTITTPFAKDKTIADIAYDVNKKWGYTVYVEENGKYVPYLVLTDSYGSERKVLLFRKYVMEEYRPFQEDQKDTYYFESSIDEYLNNEFLTLFEPEFKEKILYTMITASHDIWEIVNNNSENPINMNITRKAFLLSMEEIALKPIYEKKSSKSIKEGIPLKYFSDLGNKSTSRQTYKKKETTWWLRTLGYYPSAYVFSNQIMYCGVRPAFCVDKSNKIIKSNDIVAGKMVYIFK